MYWTSFATGTISKRARSTGAVTVLATGQKGPWQLVVDATHVYWGTNGASTADGTIARVPIGGGPVTVLADGQPQPVGRALDDASVYWGTVDGAVRKVTK